MAIIDERFEGGGTEAAAVADQREDVRSMKNEGRTFLRKFSLAPEISHCRPKFLLPLPPFFGASFPSPGTS